MVKRTDILALSTHQRDPFFDVLVKVVWTSDYGSCTGGNVAFGGTFNVRQVKGDDPDKKG